VEVTIKSQLKKKIAPNRDNYPESLSKIATIMVFKDSSSNNNLII